MGYTTVRHRLGEYQDFWPDNDENTLYIPTIAVTTLEDIHEKIAEHFQTDDMKLFEVEAEHIQTYHLRYDSYDPSDYTNFIVIRRKTPVKNPEDTA